MMARHLYEMLRTYREQQMFYSFCVSIDFRRQILTSNVDDHTEKVKKYNGCRPVTSPSLTRPCTSADRPKRSESPGPRLALYECAACNEAKCTVQSALVSMRNIGIQMKRKELTI